MSRSSKQLLLLNTLRPRQNGRRFADYTFKRIFFNENIRMSNKISLKFVPKVPINNIPALVQIMAWRLPGNKPLSEPMIVRLQTHICVSRPQWVNSLAPVRCDSNLTVPFSNSLHKIVASALGEICCNARVLHWWDVNTVSGNSLLLSSNKDKPSPEPMLAPIYFAILPPKT